VFSPEVCYVELRMNNRDFLPLSRFILETMQDTAIVTMENKYKLVYNLSNSVISDNLE